MKAHEICARAAELTAGDRDRVHGSKAKNFGDIAALWSAYLTRRLSVPIELLPSDAARLMQLLKIARTLHGEVNIDDSIDAAGYAGCTGELMAAGL